MVRIPLTRQSRYAAVLQGLIKNGLIFLKVVLPILTFGF